MIPHCPTRQDSYELLVDGIPMKLLYAPNGIKVSTHTFDTLVKSYKNSWETMVALQSLRASAAKETSLLTPSHFLQRQTSPQGSTKYLNGMDTGKRAAL